MAQAPQQPGGNGAAQFIRQIVSDPKNVPDVTLLTGYLGASSEEAHERLYLSPDLTNYVEIPKAAILHQAPLPKEQDAHGGVTLWVKKDAALQYKMAPAAQALANYFAGAIQAGAAAAPVPLPPKPTVPVQCGPQTIAGGLCPQTQVGCNTDFGTCAATCVPQLCPPPTAGASCGCTIVVACATLNCPTFFPCTTNPFCRTQDANCPTRVGPCLSLAPCVTLDPAQCSIACPTRFVTCDPACNISQFGTCNIACLPTRVEVSCNFACNVTINPAACPIASGVACPVVSAACPQVSLGCGGFPGQPGFGGQQPQAAPDAVRSVACGVTNGCAFTPACPSPFLCSFICPPPPTPFCSLSHQRSPCLPCPIPTGVCSLGICAV